MSSRVTSRAAAPKPAAADESRYKNQAVSRVLAVLSKFIGPAQIYGVTELSRELGMTKNMVHRALTTLLEAGYVTRDSTGERYQIGYRALMLTGREPENFDIRSLCRPFMEQLHALSGESVFLSIIVGRSRVNIDDITAQGPRVSHISRGRAVPLHCTKMSRVLLAYLSDEEIAEYVRLASPLNQLADVFPETVNDTVDGLMADIAQIRRDGSTIWRNPHQYGASYVTFPVLDNDRRPHAIITVGGPMERFSEDRIQRLMPAMRTVLEPLDQQARLFPANPVFINS
jgi:DNA-binding IclR family transcriptional regulator